MSDARCPRPIMYVIEDTLEPCSTVTRQVNVASAFRLTRAVVTDGDGLVVLKVASAEKALWQRPIELTKISGPLNLFHPRVAAGVLTLEIQNPTKKSVHFKIVIT